MSDKALQQDVGVTQATHVPLTSRTASGFAWLAARTVVMKVIAFGVQIVLAYLLVPEDFGLVGLAYTFAAFANLVSQAGLRQVLIQQHDRFEELKRPALWLSVTAGFLGSILIAAMTPVAVAIYAEPHLTAVMLTLALAPPVEALGIVPRARLDMDMRFRFLAGLEVSLAVVQAAVSITLAALGAGALAVVAPRPIVSTLRTIAMWAASEIGFPGGPTAAGWSGLLKPSAAVVGAVFAYTLTMQGDYLVLGIFYDSAVVGLYYFAFNLSMQSVALLTTNLQAVLLPALSHIKADRDRQAHAMLRSTAVLSLIGAPVAMFLAAVSDRLIRLVFDTKWEAAAGLLALLSLATIGRMLGSTASNLMQAQGRFRTYFMMHIAAAMMFFPVVGIGAMQGAAQGVAVGVLAHAAVYAPLLHAVAIRPAAVRPGALARAALGPVAAAVVAFAPLAALSRFAGGSSPAADMGWTALVGGAGGVVYLALAHVWCRSAVRELLDQLAQRMPAGFSRWLLVWR